MEPSSSNPKYLPTLYITPHLYLFVFCASLNSCNLGYDIGVNTSVSQLIQSSLSLSDVKLELFMGSLNLFSMVGAIFSSHISDIFGRRGGFLVAAVGFIFGILTMSLSKSFEMLFFGRIFVGLGVGFGLAIDPVYISELCPREHRGRLVTWSEIALNMGIVIGFSSGLIFKDINPEMAWRFMFASGIILPSILILLVIYFMPESPRWLISKGRLEEARYILSRVYPKDFNINTILQEIQDASETEKLIQGIVTWRHLLVPSPAFRYMLLTGIGTAVAQQVTGIDAIQYFLVFILSESGIKSRENQSKILILLGVIKLLVIFAAGHLFDTRGRKPLLFLSLSGMIGALLFIAFSFQIPVISSYATIVGLALYLASFSAGLGPGAWLIPSEVFSTSIRIKAMSLATFMNRLSATIMASSILTMVNLLSWTGYFLMLSIICIVITHFFMSYLPETKNRSLENMTIYFAEITGDDSILEAEKEVKERQRSVESGNQDHELYGTMLT